MLQTLKGHSDWVMLVAVSLDGKQAVSGSGDKTVRLWGVLHTTHRKVSVPKIYKGEIRDTTT